MADAPQKQEQEAVAEKRPFRVFGSDAGWSGAVREFAIIVAGVLAALAAQAWWEGHQERAREESYIAQLLDDTRETETRLIDAVQEDSLSRSGARKVIDALTTSGAVPADSFSTWIGMAGRAADFKPVAGTYQALVQSGDLRLIRDESLRAQITAYAATLEYERQRFAQLRQSILDAIGGLARELPFMRRVFLEGPDASAMNIAQLRADDDAIAVIFVLHATTESRLANLIPLLNETTRMREALEVSVGLREPAPPDSVAADTSIIADSISP